MFNLKDRQMREFGLAPTHEEVITNLASELINSYKQLPQCFYQIQTKFRDEIRPRFGLMRSREFVMKDAYSFHSSEEDLKDFYKKMEKSYENIFRNCGLKTVGVDADSGSIGDAASKEFMVIADSGEDTIIYTKSGSYAANIEKALSIPSEEIPLKNLSEGIIKTPNQKTISELCEKNNLEPSQLIKVVLYLARLEDESQIPILICIRGDHTINEVKVFNLINQLLHSNLISLALLENDLEIKKNTKNLPVGFLGPDLDDKYISENSKWKKNWLRIVDHSAVTLSSFISGANEFNYHKLFTSWESITHDFTKADIRNAQEGDLAINGTKEILMEKKGIEIGHIFQLGEKYSRKMNAQFSTQAGKLENLWMGCYGIGVTRLAQAAIEQMHDDNGICWPIEICPFEVVLIPTNIKDPIQKSLTEDIYENFLNNKIDVLVDDREERAGVKFKDADLIGIPYRIVIGRDAMNNEVELVSREGKNKIKLSSKDVLGKFLKESNLRYN